MEDKCGLMIIIARDADNAWVDQVWMNKFTGLKLVYPFRPEATYIYRRTKEACYGAKK